MTKPVKIVLGIATLWPILYGVIFFIAIFAFMLVQFALVVFSSIGEQPAPAILPTGVVAFGFFAIFLCLHFFTILLAWALVAIYVLDVFKNERIRSGQEGPLGCRAIPRRRLRPDRLLVPLHLAQARRGAGDPAQIAMLCPALCYSVPRETTDPLAKICARPINSN